MSNRPRVLWALAITLLALFATGFGSCSKRFNPVQVCLENERGDLQVITARSAGKLALLRAKGATRFGRGLDENCEGGLQLALDDGLPRSRPTLPGLDGAEPRVVGAAVFSDGTQDEFIENEIQIQVSGDAELEDFLNTYGGELLRDDTVIGMADDGSRLELPDGADGWHLVRINPNRVPLDQALASFWNAGIRGDIQFSSQAMAATLAVVVFEEDAELGANQVLEKQQLLEHPKVANPMSDADYVDFTLSGVMTDDNEPSEPGDQGLSIGTYPAQRYLRHTGLPPIRFGGEWTPARVAVVDDGFSLDPTTGIGNPDYVSALGIPGVAPLQVDITNGDIRAGQLFDTTDKPWHGQGAFGVCCAAPRNRFGGAGSGGEYVRPILIKMGGSVWEMAAAIRSAAAMGAAVVNVSWGNECGGWCEWPNDSDLQSAIFNVTAFGGAVFASAGNDGDDISGEGFAPCTLEQVICVGGISATGDSGDGIGLGDNRFNYGDPVDIWGPTPVRSTASPDSADENDDADSNDYGVDELKLFGGTSAASPFVAGIAALAKVADPALRWDELQALLRDTGTGNSSADPLVTHGYPDALRLVQALRPNPPPEVEFTFPANGDQDSWRRFDGFFVRLDDPPAPQGFVGQLRIESDLDGVLCNVPVGTGTASCDFVGLATLGTHVVTAYAVDEFGAESNTSILFTLANGPPGLRITNPSDGDAFLVGQSIVFSSNATDPDGESFLTTRWTSSIEGSLGASGSGSFTRTLTAGTHIIEAEVRDAYGEVATDSVQIVVSGGSGTPVAQIVSPSEGFAYGAGPVTLTGTGFDADDGVLGGASLSWFSDQMGFIGSGNSITVLLNPNGCGSGHLITLEVVDSDGNVSVDTIGIDRAVC
ncbi:MAG: S8/S53 family peptidase [Polyangiales bacterium]